MPETDPDKEWEDAVKKRADHEISVVKKKYEQDLDTEIAQFKSLAAGYATKLEKFGEKLEKEVKQRVYYITVSIASVFLFLVVGALYTIMTNGYGAVISLQKDVAATRPVIRDATKELDMAKTALTTTNADLSALSKKLDTTKHEYEQRLAELKRVKQELDSAKSALATAQQQLAQTKAAYEVRLKELASKANDEGSPTVQDEN